MTNFIFASMVLLPILNAFHLSSKLGRGAKLTMMASPDLEVDVAVIGGGVAGTALSWLLQEQHNCNTVLIDPRAHIRSTWYPNYGEWRDEWHTLSERLKLPELKDCTTTEWEITDCFFGGSFEIPADERLTLPRPYIRVDRIKLQALLRDRHQAAGGKTVSSKLSATRIAPNLFDRGLVHDTAGSLLTLDDGTTVRCKVLIDASGLESRIVTREDPWTARGSKKTLPTGYQIAYGFIAHVDSLGPYDEKAMTLFDYRTTYLEDDPALLKEALDKPTFMYTMPLSRRADGSHRVFFEETSLVGRDARMLSFAQCRARALKRLAFHGITVLGVEEEEYCYIPMGGELPDTSQRAVAFGAAANIVHPSTGYQVCRMLAASTEVAQAVSEGVRGGLGADLIAARAYGAMWGEKNRRQRDFQAFGGDFLMQQRVDMLRGFFAAFFAVDQATWGGFLAGWPGLPNNDLHDDWTKRLTFALKLFVNMPTQVKLTMIAYAITHTLEYGPNTLLRSLTPPFLFSAPSDPAWAPPPASLGAVGAKEEARAMMMEFSPVGTAAEGPGGHEEGGEAEGDKVFPAPFQS